MTIYLNNNQITGEGAQAILDGVENSQLDSLIINLSSNKITDEKVRVIEENIEGTQLSSLTIFLSHQMEGEEVKTTANV